MLKAATGACITAAFIALACGGLARPAQAQGEGPWHRAAALEAAAVSAQATADASDPRTTAGDRAHRQAALEYGAYIDALSDLLAMDNLSEGEREQVLDGYLTAIELQGAVYLAIGECDTAVERFDVVLSHPGIALRGLLAQITAERRDQATACSSRSDTATGRRVPVAVPVSTGAVAAAVFASAVVTGVRSRDAESEARAERDGGSLSTYRTLRARAQRNARWTNGLIAGGATLAATSIVTGLLSRRRDVQVGGSASVDGDWRVMAQLRF